MIERGDIRWFRFDAPDKRRPVLPSLSQIPIVPLSTQIRGLRWEVPLLASDGLPSDCVLKPEWIKAVDRSAIGPWIATFPSARWHELSAALLDVLGLADT